jgi:hypothetical protein
MRPMEANITGVGVGYGPRIRPEHTGAGPSGGYASPSAPPPPLPHRQSGFGNAQSPPPPPPSQQQQQAGKPDLTPTEVPTPGRPLLWKGMLLVYPKGFWCQKCESGRRMGWTSTLMSRWEYGIQTNGPVESARDGASKSVRG